MKLYLLILLTISELFSSNIEHLSINNQAFTISKEYYNEYGTKGEVLIFYKGNSTQKSDKVFLFVLKETKGSCSAKSRQKGVYEIKNDNITFYNSWTREANALNAPIGTKMTVYKVLPNGTFKQLSSKLYIETSKKTYDKESAMKYLFTVPKNQEEEEKLEAYIQEVEERYKGKFVFGKESQRLKREVKDAFSSHIKPVWQ